VFPWQGPGNGDAGLGGAIHNSGTLTLDLCTFASNAVSGGAAGNGGGGRQYMGIGGNGGPGGSGGSGLGGALFDAGTASLVNCTIAFNAGSGADGAGGGDGNTSVTGSRGGAGGNGGSGVGGVEGRCGLTNCTIASNVGQGGSAGQGGSGFVWQGNGGNGASGAAGDAWGGAQGGTMVNTLTASNTPAGGDSFADPKLGPLADNGGPTWTMALLPGSPAIDAADTASAPPTDQRGFPRPYGPAADLGAFEAMPLYTIALEVSPAVGGSTTGGGIWGFGASATVVAVPGAGYSFINWAENGAVVSTSATYTFAVTADRALTANFAPFYSVAAEASPAAAGSISGGAAYPGGQSATLVASTNASYQFVAWTENGQVVSTSPSYDFVVRADRTLVANFAPYPFVPPKGSYTCLFADQTNGVSPQSAGCLTFALGASRAYSGRLQLGETKHALSGQFDGSGKAQKTIARRQGLSPLTAVLELDLLSGAARVGGTVSDGHWAAAVVGDRGCFDGRTKVAPQCGHYTMVLPGACGSTNQPAGDGYATITVTPVGLVSARVSLADGTVISPSAPVSRLGQWPFFASLYAGQGVLYGWLTFTNASDLGGSVAWIKPALKSSYYPAGFSVAASAIGARYSPPGQGTNVLGLVLSTNLTLTLAGGGLEPDLTNRLALSAGDRVTLLAGPRLNLAFTPSTGAFNGNVVNPATPRTVSFGGVVLQGRNAGSGFFLAAGQSCLVRLEPAPGGP
jgi:hypothetical protein